MCDPFRFYEENRQKVELLHTLLTGLRSSRRSSKEKPDVFDVKQELGAEEGLSVLMPSHFALVRGDRLGVRVSTIGAESAGSVQTGTQRGSLQARYMYALLFLSCLHGSAAWALQ